MKLRSAMLLVGLLLGLAALGFTIPNADAQTVTILHSFGVSSYDGQGPRAALVQGSDGNFYGTTEGGGTSTNCYRGGCGTVFRISSSGSLTNLYSFGGYPNDGAVPYAGLVQGSDGDFYGTTYQGGTSNVGTVFRISPSGSYTTLYSFAGYPNDGANPSAGLVQGSDGNFYGTTTYGGEVYGEDRGIYGNGTVFRISPSGSYASLYSFGTSSRDGYYPNAGLVQGSDGNFYGTTTFFGGEDGVGTVFRISPSGNETNLHSFVGDPVGRSREGGYTVAGLVQGADGNFYGTTSQSGASMGAATVFRISPSGSYTNLYTFSYNHITEGPHSYPVGGLVQGSDGNFYGTTLIGGNTSYYCYIGCGTLFRISPTGTYTSLYSFVGYPNDGTNPDGTLIQGTDGNFYGTTYGGGAGGTGTVFKLTVPLSPPPYPINQITAIQFFNVLDSTIVALPIPSVAGEKYQLQYTDSMSFTNWLNTGGLVTSIGGPLVLVDIAEPLPPQRFYRAVITP